MADPSVQNGLIMPIVYDGTMAWDQWLFLYEVAAEMNNWKSDSTKMANMLIFSLRGHALSMFLTLDETIRKDYEALKLKLNEVLCPEDTLDMLIQQLEQRKRISNETLIDLKVDVHKLVCKVYPGMEAGVLEKHARVAFLKSISGTSYGEKTIDAQPKTLEEALQKAQFFEQREQLRPTFNNDWDEDSVADNERFQKKCRKCKQIGHLKSHCPQNN